jgi:hypothetical protein
LIREKFGDPVAHGAETGRDVFDAVGGAREREKIAIGGHAERGMRDQHVGRAAEIGDVGEVAHGIEADVLVHGRPEHMGRDARYHQRQAVGLRPRDRLGADEAAAADAVLDIELLAEGCGERVGVEPADGVGGAAGRERHHDAHRLTRPFGGKRAGG